MSEFPVVPTLGFAVRNIFCIGRNYSEHAKELNNPVPAQPVVFLKPTSSISYSGEEILIPTQVGRVDHELELVLAIGRNSRNVTREAALSCIAGYGLGIDVTARELQEKAKAKALPWTLAKGLDTFAFLGEFFPAEKCPDPSRLTFQLTVNGIPKQSGRASEMIFDIPALIVFLSSVFTLNAGDLVFTGTPAGVGPLESGDCLEGVLGREGEAPLVGLVANVRKV
ncbi:MAG TPA: isomerase/hydrolase [Bdellovibrionales bacterium]|nr:MAG: hypothetical protein A2Z97_12285 [Bdellovibrionales bacterium GWB1_52_6]OFZ03720.1 MAG: hypothetical protein A2X97_14265 [Bdellovibrionales bacterium GWA1_52_35]OFZ41130.1 MAG: hypothetical protein A2070_08685 [Bdellovibrionales bacterium GWC1_52_8]HAR42247.1 isomerase/hydrolase [Bdellovibrionales bacterium]HCM38768.1 isomerase/hydrolase [Bdellovibrionales bacterium]